MWYELTGILTSIFLIRCFKLTSLLHDSWRHNQCCKVSIKIKENEIWFYDNKQLDVVNEFKYLGLLLNYNGKFLKTQRHIAEQER